MKSPKSRKNRTAEYQGRKLNNMDRSKVCIRAGSKCLCHKKTLEMTEESQTCKQPN